MHADYSPLRSLELAKAAAGAYDPMVPAANVLRIIEAETGCAVISYTGSTLIVAFRGTRPLHLSDWWHDGDVWRQRLPIGCSVHHGFWSALEEVRALVDDVVARTPHQELLVTGHSLGGAMAAIYAVGRSDVAELYTFGQPRTGDSLFVNLLRSRVPTYYRVANDRDVVPHLPLDYKHGGMLAWIDHEGIVTWPGDEPYHLDLFENVSDHEIEHYISLLERNAS